MDIYVKTMDSNCDWITNGKVYKILNDDMFDEEDGHLFGHIIDDEGDKIIIYTATESTTQGKMLNCDKDGNIISE